MNLIIHAQPKEPAKSLSATLAWELARRLGGPTRVIRVYESDQRYFNYQFKEEWIDLVMQSKALIFPVPMWNFTIPAALKDFLDKITKQGKLWDIDKKGNLIGLLADRPAYIIMTSGGHYPSGSPEDFVVPYLKAILKFIGIRQVRDFRIGGVSDSEKLLVDKTYVEKTAEKMFKNFGMK